MGNDLNNLTHIAGSFLVLHFFNLSISRMQSSFRCKCHYAGSTQRESMSHVCRISQWKMIWFYTTENKKFEGFPSKGIVQEKQGGWGQKNQY